MIRIRAMVCKLSPESAVELCRALERNRGKMGAELYHVHDFRATIQCFEVARARSSPEPLREIERICGS